ncbi:MAG: hypothetical protein LBP98_06590 [Tannerella sp.]|jgi:hypothetical protein|nr:hypothetical protein [Tannerella sp.]
MDRFIFYVKEFFGLPVMAWLVLIISVALFVIRRTRKTDEPLRGTAYAASNALFLAACFIEIMHVVSVGSSVWFCDPDKVGWLWTIINFFLLGGIVYNQVFYFLDAMNDVLAGGNTSCDLRLGLYSYAGGLALLILCGFFFEAGIFWALGLLAVMQIIQLVMLFRSYGANLKGAFFGSFVYLLGSIATVVTVLTFVNMLIIVVLGLAVLWLVLKMTNFGSGPSGGKARIDYSDGRSEEAVETGRGIFGERYYRGKESGRTFVS